MLSNINFYAHRYTNYVLSDNTEVAETKHVYHLFPLNGLVLSYFFQSTWFSHRAADDQELCSRLWNKTASLVRLN